ncbi:MULTISPECIES: LacI family DNA-binding transcriptional regulator [unclassified Paenibacillus]|uniref:LacI family DNA-binding transcriptional regulator n=1 Tax=unclassified Paenibacillus TaxID=185978 RepID=UPI0008D12AA8|nr:MULTISPECIES: LacI family DNA-binding transcriptional regulator [unclassified Paenibacillus]QLG41000.1 LacI family DNA-binding transcriptional regulator [Paenibacillus sp. E222]SEN44811.1 transcriptional regulator, LacI family [Paenibacillus sp. OK076]
MNKTISDIAQMAGVAKSTVSRFLNGGSVSDDTRQKIERIIKQYNYVPNTFAQSLKAKRTSIIGTVVPRLDSFATSQTLIGIDEELRNNQYQMLIANTSQDMQREIDAIYDFARQKVSGIILLAAEVTDAHLKAVEDIGIPVLLVGQQHEHLHSLVHNDDQAGYEMGKHVVEKGHRKIVYIGVTERDQAVGIHRKQGFKRAIDECGGCDVTYYETSFKMSEAIITAEAILKESKPTIIVGATDNIALGVMKIAFSNKIQIPQDLSVTGFGGYEITEMIHPTLTTVKYHYFEAGQVAAQHIIRLVQGEPVEQCTILDVEIIPRESVDKI